MPNLIPSIVRRDLTDGGFASQKYPSEYAYEPNGVFWAARQSSYHLSKTSEFCLKAVARAADNLALTKHADQRSLVSQYRRKLRSYRGRLAPFLMTTVPPVVAMLPIYVLFHFLLGVRRGLGLKPTATS